MKKRGFAIIIVVLIAIVAAGLSLFLSTKAYEIPASFVEGREKGAQSAAIVSTIINDSLKNLSQVSEYDRRGDLASAVFLIRAELNGTETRQQEAHALAAAMEQMARAIPGIQPPTAQQAALEAVSAQVAAVSHLITYNQYLSDLFTLLNERVQGKPEATTEKVQRLVSRLNGESELINELNTEFNQSLAQFDEIFEGRLSENP
jgi:hypothetical protein